ncbi:putative ribonuclease R [Nostocoides japonicum T1-X7]|uniref:Putative ribonuclease R n=1 Tax=Nostocoides japonicum T1-X7 TaxID=1194083 RepID=A0A077M262_9MICO|nr:RNB domain-containing ribonuclease [Tetrasphaera japonica]CCH78319.1 putative ribonuclease R [Tetrasphaera japonica T1-X7]
MPQTTLRLQATDPGILTARFEEIRSQLKVPEQFPAAVLAEAERVAEAPLEVPERDETDVPYLTVDPPGSMDLDQALHLSRQGSGYLVRYAIAYLPAVVAPGGAVDGEARHRGQTIYSPDERTPLHPPVVSEGAASLLPGQVRAAYVWSLVLDADGRTTSAEVHVARVRSVNRYSYDEVQRSLDDGSADERVMLLKEIGSKRVELEAERGGASLPMPEQEVTQDDGGGYHLRFRPPVPAEEWNAQISLMTGMAAADLMIGARVGVLRTMPAAPDGAVRRFRRQARALGAPWPEGQRYGDFLRGLDRTNPRHLALIYAATTLFRGAAYTPFDGALPEQRIHAAVAAPYAHVTAPLRRLVDRFGLAVCEAVCRGADVPSWAREALPGLPAVMRSSDGLASNVERSCTDATEAAVLAPHLGADFAAVMVERTDKGAVLQLLDPAVVARAEGPGEAGDDVTARLTKADVATSSVAFQIQG